MFSTSSADSHHCGKAQAHVLRLIHKPVHKLKRKRSEKGLFMTKKEMARAIAEEMNQPQTLVQEIVQRVFDGIIDTLEKERRIELRNFGVFEVKQRKPRKARNPRTGESVMVPAKLVVSFKPGREMEERVGRLTNLPAEEAVAAVPSETAT
jgi:integration host factor subunit beta